MEPTELWLWEYTDPVTLRRKISRYKMTEKVARQTYGELVTKVEGSRELRTPAETTSSWQKR